MLKHAPITDLKHRSKALLSATRPYALSDISVHAATSPNYGKTVN